MNLEEGRQLQLDRESQGVRYYRNAVERHWDPFDIDLERDREHMRDHLAGENDPDATFEMFRRGVARFGAGEQAVTEDLAPLACALDSIDDQLFISTQLYEEGKHTDFFDRYWREVIHGVEADLDIDRSSPTDHRWFNDAYDDLFERNEHAMYRLLDAPTPENFALAYTHYHLVIEGILAQTGYYGMQSSFSESDHPELPYLPGLYEGFSKIRQDEGRHVGFGMTKLKELVTNEGIDPQLLDDTVMELMPLVNDIAADPAEQTIERGVHPNELHRYATEKHVERMEQIRNVDEDIPDVETLTKIETVDD